MRRAALGLVLAAVVFVPAASAAAAEAPTPSLIGAAEASGKIDRDTANLYRAYAIGRPGRLPAAYLSNAPWDGTLVLLRLHRQLRRMPRGRARDALRDALEPVAAATTEACGDEGGTQANVLDTANFHITYDTIGAGLSIGDYANSLQTAWSTEVGAFGWAAPPVYTPNPPAGNRYHVRVDPLSGGLYGYVTNEGDHAGDVGDNPNSGWNDGDASATCMVLNDDYTGFPSPPQASLDSTTAHEFNHSLQFGIGALEGANLPDENFIEGGATWMEDEVQDGANDNYNYLWPDFDESMGAYEESSPTPFPYPYWITFRGLTERFGTGPGGGAEQVMQDFWEATSKNTGNNLTAMGSAMAARGVSLGLGFHDYAVAVKYNRACGGGYVLPFCFDEGPAYVAAAGATPVHHTIGAVGDPPTAGTVRDDFALNWVALPDSDAPYRVTLQNASTGGSLRGTVACDTGGTLRLVAMPAVVGPGASRSVEGVSTADCGNPVLAITNEAQSAPNPAVSVARPYTVSTGASSSSRTLSVTKSGSGGGTVTSSPAGIDCGSDCSEDYADGTDVTLTPSAAAGSQFSGWAGDCSGTGSCTVSMDAARGVTALFTATGVAVGGIPPPVVVPQDVTAPTLTRLRMSARRFRAGRRGPSVAVSVGTRVSYRLSEAGKVAFRVERQVGGRRVGGRCRATTRRNRNRRRCIRWVRVRGSFTLTAQARSNSFRFRGRMAGRRLRPRRYRLVAIARDDAGNRSPARRLRFRIVR